MTKQTYDITAWCDRTFFTYFQIEAESPEAALEAARKEVDDHPADHCGGGWDWDSFRVEEADGSAVLEHEEPNVKLRYAAKEMLAVLKRIHDAPNIRHDMDLQLQDDLYNVIELAEGRLRRLNSFASAKPAEGEAA